MPDQQKRLDKVLSLPMIQQADPAAPCRCGTLWLVAANCPPIFRKDDPSCYSCRVILLLRNCGCRTGLVPVEIKMRALFLRNGAVKCSMS